MPAGKRFCGGCGRPAAEPAEPAPPEPAALSCVKCGAVYAPGKRFCKQCGHAVGTPASVPSPAVSPGAQAAPAPKQTSIPAVLTERALTPPLQPATPAPAFSAPVDPAPPKRSPILHRNLNPRKSRVRISPPPPRKLQVSSPMKRSFSRCYKFSGDEQEPPAPTLLQADSSAHDRDSERFGRSESDDSHAGMFSSLQDSASTPRRTLVLPIGAVAIAALLGVGWFVVTHYHSSHPAAQVPTPATAPPTAPAPAAALPANSPPQAAPPDPIAAAKPAPNKLQSEKHQAPLPRAASKSVAADPQPKLPKHQEANCALDSSLLPRMLDQADRNREQGNYADAARQYRSVLACDPKNPRAFNGLEVTLTDIQHQ